MSARKPKSLIGHTLKCPLCPRIFKGDLRNIEKLSKMHIKASHDSNATMMAPNTYVPEAKDQKAFTGNLVNHMSNYHKKDS